MMVLAALTVAAALLAIVPVAIIVARACMDASSSTAQASSPRSRSS